MAAENDRTHGPSLTPAAAAGKAKRAERLVAEMRRNLLKRKQQQRQLDEAGRDLGESDKRE